MPLTPRQSAGLLISVAIVAACSLVYELLIGALSSYLFGSSVTHFSITVGLFMCAMGLGSFASRWITKATFHWFVLIEIAVGLVGGASAAILYGAFALSNLYYVAMSLLILLTGGLVGMEIPLLTRLINAPNELRNTLANVLAVDYLGALVGSLLFPIVLLPELGLLRTAFITGLLNLSVAGVCLAMFRAHLPQWRWLTALTVFAAGGLLAGFVWANSLTSLFEEQLYDDPIIYSQQTPYQRIILTRWGDDVRLFLDGNLQFSSKDEYRYHELLVHPAMSVSRNREAVLILGGGDGLAAREVLKYADVQQIVLVDIDPAMTQLSASHPTIARLNAGALVDPRVTVLPQDAYKYLEETAELFGVIIVDLPDPNNESLGKLYSREFYTLIRRHLARGGALVVQSTSPYFAREAYWCIIHTVASVGLTVQPYHGYVPSFGDWGFVLASDADLSTDPLTISVPTRYLTPEIFTTNLTFDADIAEVPTVINTLDSQALLGYYEKAVRQWR